MKGFRALRKGQMSLALPAVASSNTEAGDPFFMDDLTILIEPTRLIEFFPTKDQTLEERLNSIARLVIYTSVALSLYKQNPSAIHIGAIGLIFLILMWRNQTKTKSSATSGVLDKFDVDVKVTNAPCTMPTKENPFMNPLYDDPPGKPPACKGPGINEMVENLFKSQLYEDVEDLYDRNQILRFNTVPSTVQPPEREKLTDWMFKGYPNCKTNPGDCIPETDLRMQREYTIAAENEDDAAAVFGTSVIESNII